MTGLKPEGQAGLCGRVNNLACGDGNVLGRSTRTLRSSRWPRRKSCNTRIKLWIPPLYDGDN